jgi:transposase InsO family protein
VPHANAPLSELGRLRLARVVIEQGWPLRVAAERFNVSPRTAKRWADRYREQGPAGMADRSSRPRSSPARTAQRLERRVVRLRIRKRWGPRRIAARLGLAHSTVSAVLRRYKVPLLRDLDRATGVRIRRYEHPHPGDLVHIDIKKQANIPDGGGHRTVGRARGIRHRFATKQAARTSYRHPRLGYSYLHSAVDDHSRVAFTLDMPDETADSAVAFWHQARAFYAGYGITIQAVMTDNGAAYRSHLWRDTLQADGVKHRRTRPYRPQTNGKVERYHQTLANEWAYAEPYLSEQARRDALPAFLHAYNHHRSHTALGGQPPISRVTNLPAHHI